jgi:sporulation protein YlmC with PRC-barrel domain
MNLQALLDKHVITADGVDLGKIYDFRAKRDGAAIVMTHIRVGGGAWVERLRLRGVLRRLLRDIPELDIPWEAIAAVDQTVQLAPGWDRARCEACRRPAA